MARPDWVLVRVIPQADGIWRDDLARCAVDVATQRTDRAQELLPRVRTRLARDSHATRTPLGDGADDHGLGGPSSPHAPRRGHGRSDHEIGCQPMRGTVRPWRRLRAPAAVGDRNLVASIMSTLQG
jgi:hypothetical protein